MNLYTLQIKTRIFNLTHDKTPTTNLEVQSVSHLKHRKDIFNLMIITFGQDKLYRYLQKVTVRNTECYDELQNYYITLFLV